ncbi:MAG: hypothetical protein HY220_03860 [Candidatus Sungbacteria bacterium]|uniref:Uncharacterized protein n=1 Tax=Candidatus Sungiibacteriota bacterium TaxID=2750080 RepID=A0A9D6LUC5_9BACT|nr:hypothetical protein [Candidatus Sungbacteria bacterium]
MKRIITVLCLAIIAVGGYFLLQPASQISVDIASQKSLSSESNQTMQIPADWKTYTSSQYQFLIRYPGDWSHAVTQDGVNVFLPPDGKNSDQAPISVDLTGAEPYKEATDAIGSSFSSSSKTAVRIGGLAGIQIAGYLNADVSGGKDSYAIFTMLAQAGRLVSIDYIEPTVADYKRVYFLMLSSFAFTK